MSRQQSISEMVHDLARRITEPLEKLVDADAITPQAVSFSLAAASAAWVVALIRSTAAQGDIVDSKLLDQFAREHRALILTHLVALAPDLINSELKQEYAQLIGENRREH